MAEKKMKVPNPMEMIMERFDKESYLEGGTGSKLRQWPVQLNLVAANAPYFKKADLLVTADCVPYAYSNYHEDFLKDKALVVGCPKQDFSEIYTNKLTDIIKLNDLNSVTVLRMEVPCCTGIENSVIKARDNAAVDIQIKVVTISIKGEVLDTVCV